MSARAFESVGSLLVSGADADDVLRAVVTTLADEPGISWAGILFVERDALVVGPQAGTPDESRRVQVPVVYHGERVGELVVDGEPDVSFLEPIAALISAYVLLGWDTGGEAWDP